MHEQCTFIFEDERPFSQCHASTLLVLPNGEVLVAYFAGTHEKHPDVAIWLSRRALNGQWTAPIKVADEVGIAHWNPVLFADETSGRILLYYKVGHEITDWKTRIIHSEDGGQSWSEPSELVAGDESGGRGPVRNKPIVRKCGRWLAPASVETETAWDAFVDISDDQGQRWYKSASVPLARDRISGKGVIQPTLWEDEQGVHMLLRSTEGWVYRSDSTDGGLHWTTAYPTSLPNNNSGIDLVQTADGDLYLAMNPVEGDWAARTPLVLQRSSDGGQHWQVWQVLEDAPGEYSYPAVVTTANQIHVTYTWRRERIVYGCIPLDT